MATNGRSVLVGAKTFSENPRCPLARKQLWRVFREDYFAVPDVLARKKEFAEFFAKRWGRRTPALDPSFECGTMMLRKLYYASGFNLVTPKNICFICLWPVITANRGLIGNCCT